MEFLNSYNIKEILYSESFWVAVAFLIFVILSFKRGKQIILSALDKRISDITTKINDSKKIKEEAENNLKEAKKNLINMIEEKKKILSDAKKESEILRNKLLKQEKINNERLNKKILERIDQSKNQAVKDIKEIIIKISNESIKEALKNQKDDIKENDLIAKSILNLLKKKKQEKSYREL